MKTANRLTTTSSEASLTVRAPKLTSELFTVTLFNEEIGLTDGIAKALLKQKVPIRKKNGHIGKMFLMREAIRIAAATLGAEVGDRELVDLANRLKTEFQAPRQATGRPSRLVRKTVVAQVVKKSSNVRTDRKRLG